MTRQFKLHKIAGPSGTFAGYILLIFGIISSIFVISGVVVLILGLFLSFGDYCSTIHAEKRRVKTGIKIFGWSISGKWIEIDDSYNTEISKSNGRYTVYSKGNRKLEIENKGFKIFVRSEIQTKSIAVAFCTNLAEAQEKEAIIRDLLQLKKE